METSPPPYHAPRRKPSRRKLLAIGVVVAIAISAFATWQILRPRSIAEVLAMEGLRAGSDIAVQGTITAIGREHTSYGPRVYLRLDGNTFCGGTAPWNGNILADPNASYLVGASYQTTLHLQSFSVDGDPAVWAPELACPFPPCAATSASSSTRSPTCGS